MVPSSTSAARGAWNDPFRVVLAISLVALVAWIALHSGAQGAETTRLRTDVDFADPSASRVVTVDDESPFDTPLDDGGDERLAEDGSVASPVGASGASAGRGTAGRGGSHSTTHRPGGTGPGTSTPPTDGTGSTGGAAPSTDTTQPGNNGQGGGPGTTGNNGVAGGLGNGVGNGLGNGNGQGNGNGVAVPGVPGVTNPVEVPVPSGGSNGNGSKPAPLEPVGSVLSDVLAAPSPLLAPLLEDGHAHLEGPHRLAVDVLAR